MHTITYIVCSEASKVVFFLRDLKGQPEHFLQMSGRRREEGRGYSQCCMLQELNQQVTTRKMSLKLCLCCPLSM